MSGGQKYQGGCTGDTGEHIFKKHTGKSVLALRRWLSIQTGRTFQIFYLRVYDDFWMFRTPINLLLPTLSMKAI